MQFIGDMSRSVTEFYDGKCIFVTGATGFVGKVLVEKILRSLPGVKNVYLLMRQKKGTSGDDRLKDLWNSRIFDNLRANNPDAFNKIKLISGDLLKEDLGICNDDRGVIQENCNIVFHSAACVRFDQKLKDAVETNTTATLRLLKLAETMNKLEAFVHLSTAYCRCELDVLDEKLYPAVHEPRKIIELTQWLDDKTLDYLEPRLISSEPNTYSYTKAITEDLVAEFSSKFPIAIGRPSIVTASWKEPMPGWVDNINGPTGLLMGSGKGVIRTMLCEGSYLADAIPVDIVTNGCILIAHNIALERPKDVRIFNLTLSGVHKITWREVIELGEKYVNTYPHLMVLWYPGGNIRSYWITHQINLVLTHILPAYFIDFLLLLFRKKPFLVKIQKRISHGLSILQYYTMKEWHFKNNNFLALQRSISDEENEIFYTDVSKIDTADYLKNYVLGVRHFVCKEDPSTLPRAKKIHRIRYILHIFAQTLFYSLIAWFLYSNFGFANK
ncbi:putative fatty acyl-CoA reductase CG5065 isoform X1 [Danaus plexippus]|uniref:putative fatty acyl-CoA reductase CG5065 isoform X1 n=2 Tax=Danaus plexippus TaxID=13037 RepID=UPI002AB22D9D|nr:putative fatty acyl-CoA reductase CG5065 isoform X1 [Danaus plexippus]